MGIAAKLGKFLQAGKGSVEKRQEIMGTVAVALHRFRPTGGGKRLDLGFQDFVHPPS
jgi:hypothetical protein